MGATANANTRRETVDLGGLQVRVAPETWDPETREFEVVMSTGASVRRYSWRHGYYDEVLSLDERHIRLDFFNSGRAPFCEEHRHYEIDKVVGSIVANSVRFEGGEMIGRVRMHETERAEEMAQRIRRGELPNVSLGYLTYEHEVTEREDGPDTREAIDWEPRELSLTPMPADDGAHTRSSTGGVECVVRFKNDIMGNQTKTEPKQGKSATEPKQRAGESPQDGQPSDGQPAPDTRSGNGDGAVPPESGTPASPDTRSAPAPGGGAPQLDERSHQMGVEAERQRQLDIRALCTRSSVESTVADDMITRGISLEAARNEILDKWLETRGGPGISNHTRVGTEERDKVSAAMERALLNRHDPMAYEFEERDDARNFGGDTLLELGTRYLQLSGRSIEGLGNKNDRAAAILSTRAGRHSTSDFPGVLGNVARKILLDSYDAYERDFLHLVRERSTPDFKPVDVHRIGGAAQLKPVGEGSEYTYGTIGEEKETFKIGKFGRIIAVTREMLINDDLNAFSGISEALGHKAAELEILLFWGMLTDNPVMSDGDPLFHVNHGNIVDGDISTGGLTEAYTAMRLQKDIGGEGQLLIRPKHIAIPTELRTRAFQQIVGQTVPNSADQTSPFRGGLDVTETPFLSASSATEWYLIADRRSIETFVLAYLQGNRRPHFERREGFEVDGTEFKVRHEIGMKAIDWRGIVKSTGTVAK